MQWGKSLRLHGERLCEIEHSMARRAQILDLVATFRQQLVGAIQGLLHELACGLARRNAIGRRLKLPDQPLYALQQRVVKVARDALALGEARFQAAANLGGDLAHAHSIQKV